MEPRSRGRRVTRAFVRGSVSALLVLLVFGALTSAQAASVRLAVIGDYGSGSSAAADVARLVTSWSPDFVVTTGDNNYPDGAAETIDQNIGQFYHDFICPYRGAYGRGAATNRFFPVLGNHDWDTPGRRALSGLLHAPRQRALLRRGAGASPSVRAGQRPPRARWPRGHRAGELATGRTGRVDGALEVVVMHHPPYSRGRMARRVDAVAVRSLGGGCGVGRPRPPVRAGDEASIPLFRERARRASEVRDPDAVDGSQARYTAGHGAMLVEADDAQLSFRFVTTAGETVDTYTLYAMPKAVAPAAPSSLVTTTVSGSEVDLAWADNSSNETHMVIEQSTGGAKFSAIADLDANTTSYSVTGLAAQTTYQFRVVARNSDFRSPPSAPASATTGPAGPPAAPTDLIAQGASPTEIAITWVDVADNERGFIVEQLVGESWTPIASAPRNATHFLLGGLSDGATYTMRLRAYNAYGTSEPSNTVTAQTVTQFALIETNGTRFSGGQTIGLSLTAANPPGNPPLDLYVGALWPDLNTIVFLSAPNTFGGLGQYSAPATVAPMATVAPGFSVSGLPLLTFTFPAGGIPVGTYYVFAALFRQGSLADNRADNGDLVWLSVLPFTYKP